MRRNSWSCFNCARRPFSSTSTDGPFVIFLLGLCPLVSKAVRDGRKSSVEDCDESLSVVATELSLALRWTLRSVDGCRDGVSCCDADREWVAENALRVACAAELVEGVDRWIPTRFPREERRGNAAAMRERELGTVARGSSCAWSFSLCNRSWLLSHDLQQYSERDCTCFQCK